VRAFLGLFSNIICSDQCAYTGKFTGVPPKLKETNLSTKHDRLKNPNWREINQFAIYKHDRGVELGSAEKQLKLSGLRGA